MPSTLDARGREELEVEVKRIMDGLFSKYGQTWGGGRTPGASEVVEGIFAEIYRKRREEGRFDDSAVTGVPPKDARRAAIDEVKAIEVLQALEAGRFPFGWEQYGFVRCDCCGGVVQVHPRDDGSYQVTHVRGGSRS